MQEQVDSAPYFPEVFRRFTEWLKDKELGSTHKFSIVTDWYVLVYSHFHCVMRADPFLLQSLGHQGVPLPSVHLITSPIPPLCHKVDRCQKTVQQFLQHQEWQPDFNAREAVP